MNTYGKFKESRYKIFKVTYPKRLQNDVNIENKKKYANIYFKNKVQTK